MKKLFALILATLMVLSLAACGGKKEEAPAASGGTAGGSSAPAVETVTLKLTHCQPE